MFISLIKCLKFVFLLVSVLILSPCLSLIGAFYAGCAVQPVALKYPNRLVSDINCMHVMRVQYNAMQYETARISLKVQPPFCGQPHLKVFCSVHCIHVSSIMGEMNNCTAVIIFWPT